MTMQVPPPPPPPPPPNPAPILSGELERFVFNPDQFLKDDVPRDILAPQIELLVKTRINNLTPHRALEQLFKVVDYYDACEVAPHLLKLLTKNERTPDDLQRSAILARIVALVGLPEERKAAQEYYDYLVTRADTYPVLERLVALYEILGPSADSRALAARIDARVKALDKDKAKDDASRANYTLHERLLNFTLNRAVRANALKKKLLDIADRPARINEEIKTYLAMQYGFGEYLPIFAGRRLRRETWAPQPDQQLQRTMNVSLRQEVATALRNTLPAIDKLSLTQGEKDFMKVAVYDAIAFFSGPLSNDEVIFMNEKGPKQKDILTLRKFH